MDITERIANVAGRWASDYAYQIAADIVAELGLTENRQYTTFDSSLIGATYTSRMFYAADLS